MKFEVTKDLIEEMAECIYCCKWVSQEEIAAYIKGCITGSYYEPEGWSLSGRGESEKNRDITINKEQCNE